MKQRPTSARNLALIAQSATLVLSGPAFADDGFCRIADAADGFTETRGAFRKLANRAKLPLKDKRFSSMGWKRDDGLIAPFQRFPADQKDHPIVVAR